MATRSPGRTPRAWRKAASSSTRLKTVSTERSVQALVALSFVPRSALPVPPYFALSPATSWGAVSKSTARGMGAVGRTPQATGCLLSPPIDIYGDPVVARVRVCGSVLPGGSSRSFVVFQRALGVSAFSSARFVIRRRTSVEMHPVATELAPTRSGTMRSKLIRRTGEESPRGRSGWERTKAICSKRLSA